jgi:fumarylacetoacetase
MARTSSKHLLWSFPQMIAHHTLGGCPLRTGDLLGSGTISGPAPEESGSLLEMSENGKKGLILGGSQRSFLEDGDTLVLRAFAGPDGARVGFGECSGLILPTLGQ